jgi:hypothetical protein
MAENDYIRPLSGRFNIRAVKGCQDGLSSYLSIFKAELSEIAQYYLWSQRWWLQR